MRTTQGFDSPPARRRGWGRVFLVTTVSLISVAACVYDPDQRCGPGQVLETDGSESCVCAKGHASTPTGCVLCQANEEAGPAGCVCKVGFGRANPTAACAPCGESEIVGATGACECAPGFAKAAANAPCAAAPAGQGTSCDAASAPCTDATHNYCHVTPGTTGYCTTQACTSDAECTGGYLCDLKATPSYCRRPPIGFGKSCTSDADCAGTEATYCDLFVTQSCLVSGCSLTPDNCFSGTECCDLSAFGIAQPLCVLLSAGGCTT